MKNAIVFGGSGFLGGEIVQSLSKKGYRVLSTYNSHRPDRSEAVENCAYRSCDVTDPAQVSAVFSFCIEMLGIPDVVINASGIALKQALLTDIRPEDMADLIQVDLLGALYISREAAKAMHPYHSGCIVHISSMWGACGASCEVPYSAAKGGLNAMVKALAREIGPDGIRVNAVAPGLLLSPMNAHLSESDLAAFREDTPLGCYITAEDVCRSILYLIDSPHVTGQILAVDGGITI